MSDTCFNVFSNASHVLVYSLTVNNCAPIVYPFFNSPLPENNRFSNHSHYRLCKEIIPIYQGNMNSFPYRTIKGCAAQQSLTFRCFQPPFFIQCIKNTACPFSILDGLLFIYIFPPTPKDHRLHKLPRWYLSEHLLLFPQKNPNKEQHLPASY